MSNARSALVTSVAALALCGLVGCNKDAPAAGASNEKKDDKVASCNMPGLGSCREYRGGNLAMGTDMLKKLCDPKLIGPSAEFKEVACPTDKIAGSCTMLEGKDIYYEGSPMADSMESTCKTSQGTFAKGK